jgi:calcium/calmodulin-dependent protein kinase kinase 2
MTYTLCVAVYQGCVFFNQYLVVKFLGKGACGKVYLVMDTLDNCLYALKITQKTDFSKSSKGKEGKPAKNPLEDLRAEVAIMGRVAHPSMVCLKEVVDDPQRNKVLIVMNYAEGGPILPRKAIAQGMMLPEDICRCDNVHHNQRREMLHMYAPRGPKTL